MPNHRCCVGGCNNDWRYPEKLVVKSHVKELKFHHFPKDELKRKLWVAEVSKGLVGFQATNNKVVCSNHFEFGKPTFSSSMPTMYLAIRSYDKSPKKRRKLSYKPTSTVTSLTDIKLESNENDKTVQCSFSIKAALVFANLTRDNDVKFFTGFSDRSVFELVFNGLSIKASDMHYWKGLSNTTKDLSSPRDKKNISLRKLTMEQEFLLTMMRLRLRLLIDDLAFRFKISGALASSIFTTWIKLMSKELSWLIVWPDRNIIRRNLPAMFRKYYPDCCIIIDCSELFIETPSSLDVAAMCWSNYKHHSTIKYLLGITPNGAISFLSDCYGGRASDIFIVNNSNFFTTLTTW